MIGKKTSTSHLIKADPAFASVIKSVGTLGFKAESKLSIYEMLARAIANQQLHNKAARTILARFNKLTPGPGFPKAEDVLKLSDEAIRACGFSWAKVAALKDLAQKQFEGLVPTRRQINKMSDDAIVEALTQVRGIGRWTVQMMLIFQLGRTDVLPIDDFGIKSGFKTFRKLKELPKPKILDAYGARWAPHRTTASLYLWRLADLEKSKAAKK